FAQPRLDLRPANEPEPEGFGQPLPRDVVLRRSEASRHDHGVCARGGQPEGRHHPLEVVADRLVVEHVDPDFRETLRDPLGVVVADLSEQDLRPDADHFGFHRPAGSAPVTAGDWPKGTAWWIRAAPACRGNPAVRTTRRTTTALVPVSHVSGRSR